MDLRQVSNIITTFSTTNTLLICLGLLSCYLLGNRYGRAISQIPGPTIASCTGFWRLWDVHRGSAHLTHIRLHQQYGPLVRIGPNHISVGDPKAIPIIYGPKSGFMKTDFYPIFGATWQKRRQLTLFSTTDKTYHRNQKRPAAAAYSMSSLLEMENAVDSCSNLLSKRLDEFATTGKDLDLGVWLQYYAFDVVGELTFDSKFGFLEKGIDVDNTMETIKTRIEYGCRCGQVPYMDKFLLGNSIIQFLIPSMESGNQTLNFTLKAINSRCTLTPDGELGPAKKKEMGKDQLSKWIAARKSDPTKFSTRDIIVLTGSNVSAGSDTTAIALRAIFYNLMRNSSKSDKLVAEIDEAQRQGKLGYPISYKESTTHLPYTQAVIKEAMRLHPSVGLLLERYVPPGGVDICNQHIPAGTVVGVNPWVVHRDPVVFPDPEVFLPERWIESEADKLKEMEAAFFNFGAGSRTCLGKNMSTMEMSKVVPQLLRDYSVSLADPGKEWVVRNAWFVQQSGLVCKLERRDCSRTVER